MIDDFISGKSHLAARRKSSFLDRQSVARRHQRRRVDKPTRRQNPNLRRRNLVEQFVPGDDVIKLFFFVIENVENKLPQGGRGETHELCSTHVLKNIRLGRKDLLRTNVLAYFAGASTKKKIVL
jgi:hypothetical protein